MYLYLMRGTPLIVMVIAAYYLLPYAGIDVSATTGGVLVVSLYFGAFMSEVFRGALASVPRGQWDAGRALGNAWTLADGHRDRATGAAPCRASVHPTPASCW